MQRYAHLAPEFQERAIAALEAYGKEAKDEVDHCPKNIANKNGNIMDTPKRDPALEKLALKTRKPLGFPKGFDGGRDRD